MLYSVVFVLLQNLSQLLANESNLLYGVEGKVRSLHNELEIINAFIKTSQGKNNKNKVEKTILNQIKDITHVVQDTIDTFIMEVSKHKRRSTMVRMLHSAHHAKLLHEVAQKIDIIQNTIKEIHDNKLEYDMPESSNNNDHQ